MIATASSFLIYHESCDVPPGLRTAAEAVLSARGEPRKLLAIFEHSQVAMVMVDTTRRYAEVNRPAQRALRHSLEKMRTYAIDDLTPDHLRTVTKRAWTRLLDTGCVTGCYQAAAPDGSRLEIPYCGLANVLPGLHLIAFATTDLSADGPEVLENDAPNPGGCLTPREIEVIALAADGLNGREVAAELVLSTTTINTHFKNVFAKLGVRTRAGAVARAIRLGAID
jgi:PAS domain S-box-containing protein